MNPEQRQLIQQEMTIVSERLDANRQTCRAYGEKQANILSSLEASADNYHPAVSMAREIMAEAVEQESLKTPPVEGLWYIIHPAWTTHNIYGLVYYENSEQVELLDMGFSALGQWFPDEENALHMELYMRPEPGGIVVQGCEVPRYSDEPIYQRFISHALASMQICELERIE